MSASNDKTTIRLGGVPEHFNLPIHLANERGWFDEAGINLEWITYGGGTGQMTKALRENEADCCILLTEGMINDIINGNPAKIISTYVTTPLCWGIHTSVDNDLTEHSQIYTKQYAISRNGSGSHLMAIIDANGKGHELDDQQFEIINDINGALDSLKKQETDVFYWEKFTTKPYVDKGELKRIGEFPTPWPSFVIAASDRAIAAHPEKLGQMLKIIHRSCYEYMNNSEASKLAAERYGLQFKDAENWFHRTEWATDGWVSDKMIDSVVYNLKLAGIQPEDCSIPQILWIRKK